MRPRTKVFFWLLAIFILFFISVMFYYLFGYKNESPNNEENTTTTTTTNKVLESDEEELIIKNKDDGYYFVNPRLYNIKKEAEDATTLGNLSEKIFFEYVNPNEDDYNVSKYYILNSDGKLVDEKTGEIFEGFKDYSFIEMFQIHGGEDGPDIGPSMLLTKDNEIVYYYDYLSSKKFYVLEPSIKVDNLLVVYADRESGKPDFAFKSSNKIYILNLDFEKGSINGDAAVVPIEKYYDGGHAFVYSVNVNIDNIYEVHFNYNRNAYEFDYNSEKSSYLIDAKTNKKLVVDYAFALLDNSVGYYYFISNNNLYLWKDTNNLKLDSIGEVKSLKENKEYVEILLKSGEIVKLYFHEY